MIVRAAGADALVLVPRGEGELARATGCTTSGSSRVCEIALSRQSRQALLGAERLEGRRVALPRGVTRTGFA